MKNRKRYIDFISGVLVVYMVFTHIIQRFELADSAFYIFSLHLFGFFMPWFFFKGGMFFKQRSIGDVFLGSLKRLIVPYILWVLVGFVVLLSCKIIYSKDQFDFFKFCKDSIYGIYYYGAPECNLPLWFLGSLFLVRCLYALIPSKINQWVAVIFVIIAFMLNKYNIVTCPYWIANTMTGLFFFTVGSQMKEFQFNKMVLIISLISFIVLSCFNFSYVDMRENRVIYGNYYVWLPLALSGIFTINNIAKLVEEKYPTMMGGAICKLGNKSLDIYVAHWPIIIIAYYIFNFSQYE